MDILFVRNLFRPADFGGNRYPWETTSRLAARGHSVRVLTPRLAGPLPGPTSAEIHHYPVSRRTPFETFFTNALFARVAVRRALRRPPDVIVFSSYDVAFGNLLGGSDLGRIPTVYIYHSSFYSDAVDRIAVRRWPLRLAHGPLRTFMRSVESVVLRAATRVVAVSPFSRREIEARIGRADPKVWLIPTGVDVDFFSPGDRAAARSAIGVPIGARVLLTVGRLARVKRYDRAIDALKVLRQEDPSYLLILAGTGPDESALRRSADGQGGIRFAGFVDGAALRDHYRSADLLLCTSEFENWSLSILEALATGTPVAGTPRGSIPDMLRPVDPTLLFDDVEPTAIADGIRRLMADPAALERIRARSRDEVERSFSWDRTVDELLACLRSAAEGYDPN